MGKFLLFAATLLTSFFASAQAPISIVKSAPLDYNIVELQPQYPGGNKEFMKFIGKNFRTPEVEGLEGILKVSFVIDVTGNIVDIKILNDLGHGTADEIKRVLAQSKPWKAGENEGKPVRVLFNLPITIKSY
jgi:protein TonB